MFKISATGALTTLHAFCRYDFSPEAGLIQASDGNLYGTTSNDSVAFMGPARVGGSVFKVSPSGTLTVLHSFGFSSGDGDIPQSVLIQAGDGNFYGTTRFGGTKGRGTVYKMSPDGLLTVLYSFCSQSACSDGQYPDAGLVQGADGNLYGTTNQGGYGGWVADGAGTIFKITLDGRLTTLYKFCSVSNCPDGSEPLAGLTQGSDGNLYGMANLGGANQVGTVFKLTPAGVLTTLHSFLANLDGAHPVAALIQAKDGNF